MKVRKAQARICLEIPETVHSIPPPHPPEHCGRQPNMSQHLAQPPQAAEHPIPSLNDMTSQSPAAQFPPLCRVRLLSIIITVTLKWQNRDTVIGGLRSAYAQQYPQPSITSSVPQDQHSGQPRTFMVGQLPSHSIMAPGALVYHHLMWPHVDHGHCWVKCHDLASL